MNAFMYFWSWLFSPVIAAIMFLSLAALLAFQNRIRDAATVILAALASAGAVFVIKDLVMRPRPSLNVTLWADDYSFPSGHSAAAACFALLAYWFSTPKYRKPIAILVATMAILVGASRVYFGVHYLTDVLAGYALGASIAFIAMLVDRKAKMR